MKKFLIALFLMALFAVPAMAQTSLGEYPLYAKQRFVLGARAEYQFYRGNDVTLPQAPGDKEWAVGAVGAYRMVPRAALSARYTYGLDSKVNTFAVGLSFTVWDGWTD